ncbi:MAG: cytochrome c oxidase subunit 3 [Candidatus Sericytochromatia bacterium]|nr:cytochrome c oxidase subunit 3 [Candidatus Tanganyikabacteria bacterium]
MSGQIIATGRSAAGMPTGKLAVWMVIASEIPIFGGILAPYLMHRIGHPDWGQMAASLNVWIGTFNTGLLVTSSLFAMLAHAAAERGDGPLAAARLRLAAYGGLVFLCIKAYEWYAKISHDHVPQTGTFYGYYFSATGLHGIHILAGVAILLAIAAQAEKGKNLQRVELIGIYWHFVDVVWFFLFHIFYIIR